MHFFKIKICHLRSLAVFCLSSTQVYIPNFIPNPALLYLGHTFNDFPKCFKGITQLKRCLQNTGCSAFRANII